ALELRRALFEERAYAFLEVFAIAGGALKLPLKIELLFIGVVGAFPIELADHAKGLGGPAGEIGGKRLCFADQLLIIINAVDETPLKRRLGRKLLAQQREFHRARLAHEAGQNPGRAAIRHKADAAEGLEEIG